MKHFCLIIFTVLFFFTVGVAQSALPDHSAWSDITKANVDEAGKVNYDSMKADISMIDSYLEHLKNTPPTDKWSKDEKLAYWLNLYNAATVHLIASNYPTKSIKELKEGNPWDDKFVKSGSEVYSLNDIENKIIRPEFKDPRIHGALNCGANSCPKLRNEAFVPSKLEFQLNEQTTIWINNELKNKTSPNEVEVSKIFEWYKDDFKSEGGVIPFIQKYSTKKFVIHPKAKIKFLEYDWKLND